MQCSTADASTGPEGASKVQVQQEGCTGAAATGLLQQELLQVRPQQVQVQRVQRVLLQQQAQLQELPTGSATGSATGAATGSNRPLLQVLICNGFSYRCCFSKVQQAQHRSCLYYGLATGAEHGFYNRCCFRNRSCSGDLTWFRN